MRNEPANNCNIKPDKNIEYKISEVENASEYESAFFKKNKRKPSARNIVGAEICSKYRWQATVREQMRCKDVDKDNANESDQ